jgi:hypothetical protein
MAGEDSRPVPDPTTLTTAQLHLTVQGLRELLETQQAGARDITEERFRSVEQQFVLLERQRVEQKADTKAAVDAALTAQKEAVREQTIASERAIAKSEAAITKQLEQLSTTFQTAIAGLQIQVQDAKDRTALTVTRDMLDGRVASAVAQVASEAAVWGGRADGLEKRLGALERTQSNLSGRLAMAGTAITVFLTVVVIGVNVVLKLLG